MIKANRNVLCWTYHGRQITKYFENEITRYIELHKSNGIAVICDSPLKGEKNSAYIIDMTGQVSTKIMIPPDVGPYRIIYDVYYEGDNLAFILISTGAYDIACLYDDYGNFLGSHLSK